MVLTNAHIGLLKGNSQLQRNQEMLKHYGHLTSNDPRCLEKEIIHGIIGLPGSRKRERPKTAWMYNVKAWTGLSAEQLGLVTLPRDKDRPRWSSIVRSAANPKSLEDG